MSADELLAGMAALSGDAPAKSRGVTSDLTIDETLLLHGMGWEPVDVVFGVSWWSIPYGFWQWQAGELTEASTAFAGAMETATAELRDECARAGGTGVVGVSVEFAVHSRHVDVALAGTAVRRIDEKPTDRKARQNAAFVSDLSARDFVLLTRAGWEPLSLVAGASFVVAPRRSAGQWAAQKTQYVELPNLTQSLYLARERAMERMQSAALQARADGVVEVKLREGPLGNVGRTGVRVMQFIAVGTAVRLGSDGHHSIAPVMVVSLDDALRQFEATSLRQPG